MQIKYLIVVLRYMIHIIPAVLAVVGRFENPAPQADDTPHPLQKKGDTESDLV